MNENNGKAKGDWEGLKQEKKEKEIEVVEEERKEDKKRRKINKTQKKKRGKKRTRETRELIQRLKNLLFPSYLDFCEMAGFHLPLNPFTLNMKNVLILFRIDNTIGVGVFELK